MKRVQDPYFHQAKQDGFVARSAYKLQEIDRKRRLLKTGQRVLDLGCAPGSWLQVAAQQVGATGRVVGIDLRPTQAVLPETVQVIQGNLMEIPPETLLPTGERFDVILSDMAPNTIGVPTADAARSAELVAATLALAIHALRPGGSLLAKAFQGSALAGLRKQFRQQFDQLSLEKPRASRAESVELYLLGQGYRQEFAQQTASADQADRREQREQREWTPPLGPPRWTTT